ncbi:hypothetical protein [Bradyrhizobium cenepequi]|uniref:hypothetical protein n=1 Tax=Bradyrhizobium cenepequi TaxID=2821403 RepID=UPI001CE30E90|nr:hypothetical protein [Bradyrhizobium cenepequi]MCA6106313.1 hypothetical protein [Bradyrhizobium cenepequi]
MFVSLTLQSLPRAIGLLPIFREEKFAAQFALQRGNFDRFLTIAWIVSPASTLATASCMKAAALKRAGNYHTRFLKIQMRPVAAVAHVSAHEPPRPMGATSRRDGVSAKRN